MADGDIQKDPWNDNRAFGPMFCDSLVIKGKRQNGGFVNGRFNACVFPPEKEDPYAEFNVESVIMKITFLLSRKGRGSWGDETPPETGDEVILPDSSRWKVSSVRNCGEWFELEGKSC